MSPLPRNFYHIVRNDFTRIGLLYRAADYFAQARKPRTEWKKLNDLNPQLAEFELRCEARDYDMAYSVLAEIEGDYLSLWGHYRLLIELHEKLQGKISDKYMRMDNLLGLGYGHYSIGEIRKAIEYWEQGLSSTRDIENHLYGSQSRNLSSGDNSESSQLARPFIFSLGNANYYLGDMNKAFEYYDKSLIIARESGDTGAVGRSLCNLGLVSSEIGNAQKALEYHEQALAIFRESGDKRGEALILENLGIALNGLGNFEESAYQLSSGMKIADDLGYIHLQNFIRYHKVQAHLFLNDLLVARLLIEQAQGYDEPQNNHNINTLHGIIALRQGERETAQEAFTKSIAQADEILAKTPDYYSALDAKGLALCGLILAGRGDPSMPTGANDGKTVPPDKVTASTGRVPYGHDIAPTVDDAIETFRKARKIAPHAGVVKSVLRLFDELVKCDEDGILKDVREVIAGS